jgi:2-polyprenyl-3-methyl-5-hydroxy-6-metoxy-1,4-benzoquinol methylase
MAAPEMKCYLCDSSIFKTRKGVVRDAPELIILECLSCGLVALSKHDHIQTGFYEESGMHGLASTSMDEWSKETEWDDERRFVMLKGMLPNLEVLDFGCGAGGFLNKAKRLTKSVAGVELERRVREHWEDQIMIYPDVESVGTNRYDVITCFHVIEHLTDPRTMLKILATKLAKNGRMVIEVPSSEDALLTLYGSEAFQKFTYWSQHLFLFNAETLRRLAEQAGLRIVSIQQHQRYPLSNHMHWLSKSEPGGHAKWAFLDSPELSSAYASALARMGKCDTLIAHLEAA